MSRYRCLAAVLSCFLIALLASTSFAQTLAFPGAYGFGASATGGRGGTVYHVTNLNDSGDGSFRDAVSSGNRTIVFDVGGYVVLQSPVSVASNVTIAGQTAPGDGIGLMGGEVSFSGKTNIIVRNVRFRQGNLDPLTGKSAVNIGKGSNIIFDHCSFEYGQWDTLDAVGTVNFTVQNSILANPIGQQFGAHVETGPSTFYRNLWVNGHNRQPLSKDNTQYINNIVYDYQAGYTSGNTGGYFSHDIVNNYFISGPATTSPNNAYYQMNNKQSVYAVGNYLDTNEDGVLNGVEKNIVGSSLVLTQPWSSTTTTIPTLSTAEAFPSVVAFSGAFPRDEVDAFVVSDVNSIGTQGRLYKDQSVTGLENQGYGTLAPGSPFPNASGDGIADYWAAAYGMSTTDPSQGNLYYGDTGYTNLEVYFNSLILPEPWLSQDIASPALQGASSYNPFQTSWLLTGSGVNSSNTFDQGQFAYQTYAGNVAIVAQISSLTSANAYAKSGLFFRNSTAADAAFASIAVTAGQGLVFSWRANDGATANSLQITNVASPVWVKLVRQGSSLVGYYGTDGQNWMSFPPAVVSLASKALVGLAITSNDNQSRATSMFKSVSLSNELGSSVALEFSRSEITYPDSINVVATVKQEGSTVPTGAIHLWDGAKELASLSLQGDGKAYGYIQPSLSAGNHQLVASYSGDKVFAPGFSDAVAVKVTPASVTLSASCWNSTFSYGGDWNCTANLSSAAGAPTGQIQYWIDGKASSLALTNGNVQFSVKRPEAGTHAASISYPGQGNYAPSGSEDRSFSVSPAATQIQLSPSSYYLSGSEPLVLKATLQSWSAGSPSSGEVVFRQDGVVLGSVPVAADGSATFRSDSRSAGTHVFTATYSGSTNYAAADSSNVSVQSY